MRVVVQQPNFFPWLGYFDLVSSADAFVWLDNVQWSRTGRQHRCRIIGKGSNPWLTIPIRSRGHREKILSEMKISCPASWHTVMGNRIQSSYRTAPFFEKDLWPLWKIFLERINGAEDLLQVSAASVELICGAMNLSLPALWASDLSKEHDPQERLIEICESLGGEEYYSSLSGTRYLTHARFRSKNIRLLYQHFRVANDPYPNLPLDRSILDWIARIGIEESARLLRASQRDRNKISNNALGGEALLPLPARGETFQSVT